MRNIRIPIQLNSTETVTFKLEQDFDNLEIMSLNVSAYDVYAQMTSDFGVLVGRVNVNGGFGVQNAKVSVFIPITAADQQRDEILQLYPFRGVADRLPNGVRYNVFPRVKQNNISHQPIGIFPEITDLTYYPTYLEIYEKYYKFTTTTNGAGDYMIFGVPLGAQYVHMDFDLFDTKSFYVTADDLVTEIKTSATISAQLSTELTQAINPQFALNTGGTYDVKVKTDIDSMPNIFSENKVINVVPFWGDKTLHQIGITRCDFNIDYQYAPTAIFFGSLTNMRFWSNITPTDDGHYQVSIDNSDFTIREQSPAVDLKVIAYKNTAEYQVERYAIYSGLPSADDSTRGVFMISLPMYEDYYVTDEFGQVVSAGTNTDGTPSKRGVPTKGHYAFEFFDDNEGMDGNGRRHPYPWTDGIIYWTNMTAGIRVPANREGHYYVGGWATNHMELNQTLFEYDILKGSPRFYTVQTKFHKHDINELRLDGNNLLYLPKQGNTDYEFPISRTNLAEDDDVTLRGCLYSPRFFIHNEVLGSSNPLTLANELLWTPWLPADATGNYFVKTYDWLFGIGVKPYDGVNRGGLWNELYGVENANGIKVISDTEFPRGLTWYMGDNPADPENVPTPNFYARILAERPESTNRNINEIHNRFNLAVAQDYTAGMFVSCNDAGSAKFLFETSIADVTDIMPELISNNIYSSYNRGTGNKYTDSKGESYYYIFGGSPTWYNALWVVKERYFNG